MGNIYDDASAVVAWLGDEADSSDKAIGLVQNLSNISEWDQGKRADGQIDD